MANPKRSKVLDAEGKKAQREAFAAEYVRNGMNAAAAARSVGVPEAKARAQGSTWLKSVHVRDLLARHQEATEKALEAKYEITRENVLEALSNLVFADPRKLFREDGTLKTVPELDDRTAKMVSSFEVEELYETVGEGRAKRKVNIGRTTKIRMWDKNSAVDKAMKHLGLFEKDNNQQRAIVNISASDAKVL